MEPSLTIERQLPTRWGALMFGAKAWGLRIRRGLSDSTDKLQCWPIELGSDEVWHDSHAIRTPLWTEESEAERKLELGKVANLRRAAELLHGTVIDEGGIFSFWRQLGKATRRRGFHVGRMLQQGCIVPAVGGGLCQLTNALYESALRSGCEIVERHGHSVRMPHTPVHDATVAWNYVDLRFRARQRTRLKVHLDEDAMTVAVQYCEPVKFKPVVIETRQADLPAVSVRSCASCGEARCFRHEDHLAAPDRK